VKLLWAESAGVDYVWWQTEDRKTLRRINQLLADVQRTGYMGIGEPEPLRHDWAGFWSRRISDEHRLVYRIEADTVAHRIWTWASSLFAVEQIQVVTR
jgi:toxin YoeB